MSTQTDKKSVSSSNDSNDEFELPPICGIGKLSDLTKTDKKQMDTVIKERLQEFLNNREYNRQELLDGFAASTQAMIDLDKAHEEDGEDDELTPICGTGMLKYLLRLRQEQENHDSKNSSN